jgi:hypothetical protein
MLKTYRDYTTPEELFDIIEQAFAEARPETDALHFVAKRTKCVSVSSGPFPYLTRTQTRQRDSSVAGNIAV